MNINSSVPALRKTFTLTARNNQHSHTIDISYPAMENIAIENLPEWENMKVRGFRRNNSHLIKKLGEGYQSWVFICIERTVAATILATFNSSKDLQQARDDLRKAVQVVKIASKRQQGRPSTQTEIEVLPVLQAAGYPNLLRSGRADPELWWLCFEALEGRTIREFIDNNHNESLVPPIGLAWHMMYEMCEAILGLGFARKGSQILSEGRFAHSDLHSMENIMLRPSGSYRDYPDVVVIDLGVVKTIRSDGKYTSNERQGNNLKLFDNGLQQVVNDVTDCGHNLKETFQSLPDSREKNQLVDAIFKMNNFGGAPASGLGFEEDMRRLADKLANLRDEAFTQRAACYEPLGGSILASIRKYDQQNPLVSDEDLANAFEQLRP